MGFANASQQLADFSLQVGAIVGPPGMPRPTPRREPEEYTYSPERIRSILRNWDHYLAREESPATSRGLFRRGPTPESPKVGAKQKGLHGDPMAGVPVVADVRRAYEALDRRTVGIEAKAFEYQVVTYVMFGYTISGIAEGKQIGKQRTWDAFNTASERMAMFLGWEPKEEEVGAAS